MHRIEYLKQLVLKPPSELEMAQESVEPRKYQRRRNGDGTFDSICPDCMRIVGTCLKESDLSSYEANHRCEPARLAELWSPKKWF